MTKRLSEKQIEAFFEDLMEGRDTYNPSIKIEVVKGRSPKYVVKVEDMYNYPLELTVDHLKQVSEFFGTDKIDVGGDFEPGCESCDYGSSYQVTLHVG